MEYEYRVVPAPKRLKKIKGVSSTAELFAATLTDAINAEARGGWEYVRAESLTAEGPRGWFRRGALVEETMMIFRRPRRTEPLVRDPARTDPLLRDPARTDPHVRDPARSEPRDVPRLEPLVRDTPRPESLLREATTRGEPPAREPRLREIPREPHLRDTGREPHLRDTAREPHLRDPARAEHAAPNPSAASAPSRRADAAVPLVASPQRGRPLAGLFARGERPGAAPLEPRHGAAGTPPLLRPVPRPKPGEKP